MSSVTTDIATVKHYTDTSKTAQTKRVGEFLFSGIVHGEEGYSVSIKLAYSTWQGLVGGAVAGGLLGGLLGLPFGVGLPAAKAGSAIGAPIGAGLSIRYEVIQIKNSGIYDAWLSSAKAKNIYPIFQKYLADNHLEEFICPITSNLIQHPMRDPHGCVVEGSVVTEAFRLATPGLNGVKKVNCFLSKGNGAEGASGKLVHALTEDQFEYDLTYHNRLMAAILPIFTQAANDPEMLEGMKAIRAQMIETRRRMAMSLASKIIEDGISGKVSVEEVSRKVGEAVQKLKLA